MSIQRKTAKMDDRFTWKEDDLEIEDPIGSGHFNPLREFNRRIVAKKAHEGSEKLVNEESAGKEKPDRKYQVGVG